MPGPKGLGFIRRVQGPERPLLPPEEYVAAIMQGTDESEGHRNADTVRKTRVSRGGEIVQESAFTSIRRV